MSTTEQWNFRIVIYQDNEKYIFYFFSPNEAPMPHGTFHEEVISCAIGSLGILLGVVD